MHIARPFFYYRKQVFREDAGIIRITADRHFCAILARQDLILTLTLKIVQSNILCQNIINLVYLKKKDQNN